MRLEKGLLIGIADMIAELHARTGHKSELWVHPATFRDIAIAMKDIPFAGIDLKRGGARITIGDLVVREMTRE